ncbi:uncharacterized protein LOC128736214 [Sabethes cyaneus]|uniref:uncharacterized protein LOC128736214 n=1 Tax=Sabethes cyaneus TaxID=53552 RepID=UPI00237DFCEE|nr:uncharacterized protein LOC128736214 [Sabethes cyaneus]
MQSPTSHQLAARQVITRELPVFSGDPVEWPLFISSYNHSTEARGYSLSKNLLRLQRVLKGAAKDAVSSFLLHPSTVPQVLATFQTLYGRPEQIVHNLVAKVRATTAPRAEKLETLIHFGLAVQNLCGHMEAVGMTNHLSNPILLQELVDKLPANIKFSWALHQVGLPVVDLKAFSEYMRNPPKDEKHEKPRNKEQAFLNTHDAHERKEASTKPPGERREHHQNATSKRQERAEVTIHQLPVSSILFKIIPVTLYGKNGAAVNTYAFLDDGSSVTLVEQAIADQLGVDSRAHSVCIHWTSGINKQIETTVLEKLSISQPDGGKRFKLSEVYTVKNLGLPEQSLDFVLLAKDFTHLRHLPVKSFKRAVPGLLIGLSNSHLLTTTKVREGEKDEPIAAKTRVGWVVSGRVRGGEDSFQHRQMLICADTTERDLHDYVQEFFSVESLGVAVAPNLKGAEDQRARRILEETTVRTESGSRPMAERQWRCLEKRLEKDIQLYESVRQQVADFEVKGYIHVVTDEEMAGFDSRRIWYLPLGVVQNPNKPGRIRVIWDATAKVNGVSLNMMLLKGPDLLTPQLHVTFKFREREVTYSGDIQEIRQTNR